MMQISRLTAFQVPIVLKKPIRHASHTRYDNDTLIVRCELSDGTTGWGEGLPRPYVTGESIDTVWQHLEQTDFSGLRRELLHQPQDAVQLIDQFRLAEVQPDAGISARECFGNSVRCAVELAVLDAVSRAAGISIGDLLTQLKDCSAILQRRDQVRYSGAVTSMSPRGQWLSAWKMRLFGFSHVKVKVGAAGIDDRQCVSRIRRIVGPAVTLRLDANEAWQCSEVIERMQPLVPFGIASLEQPVPHADVAGLAEVRRQFQQQRMNIPVMLDESLCCYEDGLRAIAGGWCDLFNIRLSKCGGLIRSIRLAALAAEHGLGFQLGCQVGETGILSAAGRHFACNVGEIRFLEGSYDRFLVRERLTREDLTFGWSGKAHRLTGPGLGVTVDENRIRTLAIKSVDLL
jgi:L-Ala-D/L-Glu epimerase